MKKLETILPDYNNNILGITASILDYYGAKSTQNKLLKVTSELQKNPKNVVLMVLDGLGSKILDYHLDETNFLRKNKVDDISSVFPSTTATATISLRSGLSPIEHGWLGWACYFKEYDSVIELFTNKDFYSQKPVAEESIAFASMPFSSINEKISLASNNKVKTWEIFPQFHSNGFKDFDKAADKLKEICNNKEQNYIYFYWNNPDSIIHKNGCFSDKAKENINQINKYIENISSMLGDTLLIVTADHGHLDVSKYISLNEYPNLTKYLSAPPSMEARVVSFNIKPDVLEKFQIEFNSLFSDEFVLFHKQEYIEKFLGKGIKHPKINDFVGDFVALASGTWAFTYQHNGSTFKDFKSLHASFTKNEMIVPLIIHNCNQPQR